MSPPRFFTAGDQDPLKPLEESDEDLEDSVAHLIDGEEGGAGAVEIGSAQEFKPVRKSLGVPPGMVAMPTPKPRFVPEGVGESSNWATGATAPSRDMEEGAHK